MKEAEQVEIHADGVGVPVATERVREIVGAVLREEGKTGSIGLVFTSDAGIQALHRDYLGIDHPTDVLAFPLPGGPDDRAGEVYVSVDRAREVAREEGVPLEEEVLRYAVHGVLHLCGWGDKTGVERAAMWERQEAILARQKAEGRRLKAEG